jgi:hypothetical protein
MGSAAIRPSFSPEELKLVVETARSLVFRWQPMRVKRGMRRAVLAGVETISTVAMDLNYFG